METNLKKLKIENKSFIKMHWKAQPREGTPLDGIALHLLSLERADWPKLHGMFKALDAIVWQREFPVGFSVEVSALNSLYINIYHDVVVRIESRCVIKAELPRWSVNSFDFALEKLHSRWSGCAIFPA